MCVPDNNDAYAVYVNEQDQLERLRDRLEKELEDKEDE